jgi:glycosyltransferase involved in cell wall biosynthesis
MIRDACPDAHLLLVGPTEEELMRSRWDKAGLDPNIAGQLKQLVASGSIILTGWTDHVEEFYRVSDCLVFPSRREGFANAVAEAYACGVPAVLSPFIGLSDLLGRPGEEFVMADHDARHIAEAVIQLMNDDAGRERIARSAVRWSREHLALDPVLDAYAGLYRDVHAASAQTSSKGNGGRP